MRPRSSRGTNQTRTPEKMRAQLKPTRCFLIRISGFAAVICASAAMAAAAQTDSKPQEVFDSMRGSFQPAKAKGVRARYQWDLSGANGGEWWIEVNDGTYKMGKGKISDPNVTFMATAKDWVAICHDQLSGTWAYLTGRLKVRGDQGVARKLGEMFP
jgi:putative sterol carrier protein